MTVEMLRLYGIALLAKGLTAERLIPEGTASVETDGKSNTPSDFVAKHGSADYLDLFKSNGLPFNAKPCSSAGIHTFTYKGK